MQSKLISLAMLIVFLTGTAFTPAAAPSTGITVTDALGREVTLPGTPQRIVLVGKALFMVADAIYAFPEAGKNIVALGSTAQGPSNFIPIIDPAFKDKIALEIDAGPEQIAAANPDCVILKSSNKSTIGDPLEELNIPVIYMDFETPEQYDRDMKTMGQIFQNPKRAEEILTYFKGTMDTVTKTLSTVKEEDKPRTLVLYYSDKDGAVSFNVPPMGWMQTILIKNGGGIPVWEDANPSKGWTKVNFEQVAAWDPDVIFVVAYFNPLDEVVGILITDTQWKELKAVKNKRVFGFATDIYSWDQPDTRWALGLQWVASILHPDLFKDWDITAASKDFYQKIYAMDDATFEKDIVPSLKEEVK